MIYITKCPVRQLPFTQFFLLIEAAIIHIANRLVGQIPFTQTFLLLYTIHRNCPETPPLFYHFHQLTLPSRKDARLRPLRCPNVRKPTRAGRHPRLQRVCRLESLPSRPRERSAQTRNPAPQVQQPPPCLHRHLPYPLRIHTGKIEQDTRHAHTSGVHDPRNAPTTPARRE